MPEFETVARPVLALYKRMIIHAQRLPVVDRQHALAQIRAAFRENMREKNAERIQELVRLAQSKLGYLKIVTPRVQSENADSGRRNYTVRDGKVVESGANDDNKAGGGQATVKNWGPGNLDPDSVRRHESLMKRYRFENRVGGPPRGPLQ